MTREPETGASGKPKLAIALEYDRAADPAPRVVATGEGRFAEQLLEIAFANGVKVRQDADLAEILAAIEVESVIPLEAFCAVAEIMSYLYRANGESSEATTTRALAEKFFAAAHEAQAALTDAGEEPAPEPDTAGRHR